MVQNFLFDITRTCRSAGRNEGGEVSQSEWICFEIAKTGRIRLFVWLVIKKSRTFLSVSGLLQHKHSVCT
jgi:hypothetical protein